METALLSVTCEGVGVVVLFNGVPIAAWQDGVRRSHSEKLNPWVIDGGNVLRVLLSRAAADMPPLRMRFSIQLERVTRTPPSRETILNFDWDPEQAPLQPAPQIVLDHTIALRAAGVWSWTYAARVPNPSPPDITQIVAVLSDYRDALARRDVGRAVAIERPMLEELAISLGLDPSADRAEYAAFLKGLMVEDWQVEPMDQNRLQFQPFADGRLVRVLNTDGSAPVRASSREGILEMSPYFAKVSGAWHIVR